MMGAIIRIQFRNRILNNQFFLFFDKKGECIINQLNNIHFWNGNKSPARKHYELDLVKRCLVNSGATFNQLIIDDSDYPNAEDEGNILSTHCDVLITVAGNQKFSGKSFIQVEQPVCNDLLSQRLFFIRKSDLTAFSNSMDPLTIKQLVAGIPDTWADAEIFRRNQCNVREAGTLESIIDDLKEGRCDYVPLGAGEIIDCASGLNIQSRELMIEKNHMIYYPLPLVFYIAPDRQDIAEALKKGLSTLIKSGELIRLTQLYFPHIDSLKLNGRLKLALNNPFLPESYAVRKR